MIEKSAETKVQDKCDTLIAWGFRCSEPAAFLVLNVDSFPEYAIMCEKHKNGFLALYGTTIKVRVVPWTLEMNQKCADLAKSHWEKKEREKS